MRKIVAEYVKVLANLQKLLQNWRILQYANKFRERYLKTILVILIHPLIIFFRPPNPSNFVLFLFCPSVRSLFNCISLPKVICAIKRMLIWNQFILEETSNNWFSAVIFQLISDNWKIIQHLSDGKVLSCKVLIIGSMKCMPLIIDSNSVANLEFSLLWLFICQQTSMHQ